MKKTKAAKKAVTTPQITRKQLDALKAFTKVVYSSEIEDFFEMMDEFGYRSRQGISAMSIPSKLELLEYLKNGKEVMKKMCAFLDKYGDLL